ncbi:MAG: hypothetical protein RQ751_01120 [Longimicrobiales bacterium]|nr:hypothetical protein [Longimicrobiales bacterium]
MKTIRSSTLALASLLTAAACGGDSGRGGEWQGTVQDSAGIPVVHNTGPGIWSGEPGWALEEVFRVGGLDAGTEGEFSLVVGVDADADGRVYVADQQARHVQIYHPDGSFAGTLGAPGEGPGEFGPALMGVFVSATHVRVPDLTNQRVNLFTLEGASDGVVPFRLTGGVPVRWDEAAGDVLTAQLRGMDVEGMAALPLGDPIITVTGEDAQPDTLGYLPKGQSLSFAGGQPRIRLFEPEPVWDVDGSGRLAAAMNGEYRIELRRDGAVERVVTRPVERRPVTERDQERVRDMMGRLMAPQGAPPQVLAQIISSIEFAEYFPAFAQVMLGPDETLWVQRIRAVEQVDDATEFNPQDLGSPDWDVFDADGRYLGVLTMPGTFQPLRLVGDVLYGIETDDFDVQSVVGYRVRPR